MATQTIKGIDFVIYAVDGATKTMVGGQRGATLNRSAETLETTNKGSNGWKEFVSSFKEWSVDADGLYVDGDAGYAEVEEAYNAGTALAIEVKTPSGDMFSGSVLVTDLPVEMPYDDAVTYSITFQGTGALVKA